MDKYLTLTPEKVDWAIWDYLKLGLPTYKGGIYTAKTVEVYKKGNSALYKLEFDKDIVEKYGLLYAWVETDGENLELKWFKKEASRLPQAFWFKFKGYDEKNWKVLNLGQWIDPERTIGSPLIMGTDREVNNGKVQIECFDSALVAPFGRRLLEFDKNPQG